MFKISFPEQAPNVLAVKLSVKGERSVRDHHPWIFSDSIDKVNKPGSTGDIAVIFSHTKNRAMGVGLYDPTSPIRIKMLHFDSGASLNKSFFEQKIKSAHVLRQPLFESNTNSYRLIFGENDGFPGLIADVYNKVLVVKLYSGIWFPFLKDILEALLHFSQCETIVLRLSRQLQKTAPAQFTEGSILYGELKSEVVQFIEHGIHFSAHVIKGHKTGYFLDHRHNRKRVGAISKGMNVLDVFSYAGGFSVHALVGGAKEVTSLDISQQALDVAKQNAQLNSFSGAYQTITGDAFDEMKRLIAEGKKYNIVVIDPPSFAKNAKEAAVARKKYSQLANLGVQLTAKKGWLILASCSSRIAAVDFFRLNTEVLKASGRNFSVEDKTYHDIDHPITFPEGAYLKCAYYKFQ